MLATTAPAPRARAKSIRLRCPSCRLPSVGTNPTRKPRRRNPATAARNSGAVSTVCIVHPAKAASDAQGK